MNSCKSEPKSISVFGERRGMLGGIFRITDGLTATLGEQHCFDTPLAESGIVRRRRLRAN